MVQMARQQPPDSSNPKPRRRPPLLQITSYSEAAQRLQRAEHPEASDMRRHLTAWGCFSADRTFTAEERRRLQAEAVKWGKILEEAGLNLAEGEDLVVHGLAAALLRTLGRAAIDRILTGGDQGGG